MSEKIKCLICGKIFDFLAPHLNRTHKISASEYKEEFDLPAGLPLASGEYRLKHADKIRRMQVTGQITYGHLPEATDLARLAEPRPKTRADAAAQIVRLNKVKPWAKNQLPPGAKRADGRDAEKARAYQISYRARTGKKS